MTSVYKPVKDLIITIKPSNQVIRCTRELQTLKDLMQYIKTEAHIPREHQRIMASWKGHFNYKKDRFLWIGSEEYKENVTLRALGLINGMSFYCYQDPDVIMFGDI